MDSLALFDGGPVATARTRGLVASQRAILAHVAKHGSIRSIEAGVYAHGGRRSDHSYGYTGRGCCQYASKDGLEACKRLMRRGLLVRALDSPARWVAP